MACPSYIFDIFCAEQFAQNNTDCIDREFVLHALSIAIEERLTETQRELLLEYYADLMSMPEIAERHGICVASVSRTIKRARLKLWEVMRYTNRVFLNARPPERN